MREDAGRATDSGLPTNRGRLPFTGVVLAGGHSRRFGESNKAVAVLDGSTFIEREFRELGDEETEPIRTEEASH